MRTVLLGAMLLGMVACSTSNTGTAVCPGCDLRQVVTTYRSSFASGVMSPPVNFTAAGQTAVVTVSVSQNGSTITPTPVAGAPSGGCTAASLQNLTNPGDIQVTALSSGTCTFLLNSAGGQTSLQVNVP